MCVLAVGMHMDRTPARMVRQFRRSVVERMALSYVWAHAKRACAWHAAARSTLQARAAVRFAERCTCRGA